MKKMQRLYLSLSLLIGCIMLLFMSSCCSASGEIGKERAAIIAKNEALNRGWKEVEVGEARLIDGQWQVVVWRLPKVPGGSAVVKISSDGKTVRFSYGL